MAAAEYGACLQAIEAVKLEGKGVAETAVRYGMSESNVKISIRRGPKALASFIAEAATNSREVAPAAAVEAADSPLSSQRDLVTG